MTHPKIIKALSLATSCGCNLQCAYCEIAKSTNENSHKIQQETIKALQDNSFIHNVEKGLIRMGNNAKSINRIEFWGQEPTLTLHHITANIEEWKKVFPNVNNFMFSTNGVGYTDRILDFIQAIDNYGNTMRFEMQFSYDGEESNEANRGLNSASVSKNIEYFITKLNEMPLNNTKVEIHFHNVVSIQLINSITTIEEINNYIKNLYGKTEYFASLNKHNKVLVANHPDAGIEVPVDASTEDGLNFHRFYKLLNCAEENIKRDYIVSRNILNFQQRTFNSVKDMMIEEENITPFELMYKYTNDNDIIFGRKQEILNECSYCGAYLTELKVMYDGTLINCHSQIFDTKLEFLSKEKTVRAATQRGLASHGRYVNLLTSSDEEIKKVIDLAETAKKHNFLVGYNEIVTLMYLMAKYNQIDKSYYHDYEKLLKHALVISKLNVCAVTRLVKTGSIFLTNAGQIRFFCNGLLDEVFFMDKEEFKQGEHKQC